MEKKFYGIKKILILSFTIIIGIFSQATRCIAQQTGDVTAEQTEQTCSNYDPIVAMLDSLVNLNYVQRLNSSSVVTKNDLQHSEVPSYSNDIYAKRMEKIPSPIPLAFNPQVKEYIDLYAMRKRALTERVMGLAQLYFPMYEQVLDQYDMPLELKYLSIVESALNPMAVSRCGASGLWQFMLYTGKLYNLKVNSFVDERRDPYKSTVAACQYFKNMYDIYHDWLLVIAAYNCGPGNVNKAIARSGGKTNFWQICRYLPKETRGYVPAFIAVTYLMNYTSEHNLTSVAPIMSFHEADTVLVTHKTSLRDVANAIDVPYDLLTYLNPVYKHGVIPTSDEPQVLRLPTNKVNSYLANLEKINSGSPSLTAEEGMQLNALDYVTDLVKKYIIVKKSQGLASIADRYDCSVSDIKRWNKMKSNKAYKGQKLLVYVPTPQKNSKSASIAAPKSSVLTASVAQNSSTDQTNTVTDSAQKTNEDTAASQVVVSNKVSETYTASKVVWHVVQPGDTLWNIAKRYDGVTVEELKNINRLSSNEIVPGTKLKVKVNG